MMSRYQNWLLHLLALAALMLAGSPSYATWPTTIRENLPIATDPPPYTELHPFAFPYPNGMTLVVFYENYFGDLYQIIDRFGHCQFSEPQLLQPAFPPNGYVMWLNAMPDQQGGVIACWTKTDLNQPPEMGIYAQRIDSLGNLCLGDSAVRIHPQPMSGWNIGPDGDGGFFFAWSDDDGDLRAQHIGADGQPQWADSGVVLCDAPGSQTQPELTYDGQGGAYIVWTDQRPPYELNPTLFMQRLDPQGNPLWVHNGLFVATGLWFKQVLPDGQNGLMIHTDAGGPGDANVLYRIGPSGQILWSRPYVSWYVAQMVPGDPGYVYIGFLYYGDVYGQKIDSQGRIYWPTWGSGQVGALLGDPKADPGFFFFGFAYRDGFFYGMYNEGRGEPPYLDSHNRILLHALNPEGRQRWRGNGVQLAYTDTLLTDEFNVIPDDRGGAVCVWRHGWDYQPFNDIWGKRVNADGSLGGPSPPQVLAHPTGQIQSAALQGRTYTLPQSGEITLDLFDLLGRRVATLAQGYQSAGSYTARYDHLSLPSGIYLLRLEAGGESRVGKVAITK